MKDFTLEAYKYYLDLFKAKNYPFFTFSSFMAMREKPDCFCLIRHDVDRKPGYALKMAKIEAEMGVVSTYYFRNRSNSFVEGIVREIHSLGHEIGYHYECLSDENGNYVEAFKNFENNLLKFRSVVEIKTISMHGRPFKPFDNRDLWSYSNYHQLLKEKHGILGEVYLDIDYTDIAYVNDTGRNWTNSTSNLRDRTNSKVSADFNSSSDLINYLKNSPARKIVFQIHPERWASNSFLWLRSLSEDTLINAIKFILKRIR